MCLFWVFDLILEGFYIFVTRSVYIFIFRSFYFVRFEYI